MVPFVSSYKFPSDDEASSVTSGSGPSAGAQSSPHPTLSHGTAPPSSAVMSHHYATRESSTAPTPTTDIEAVLAELSLVREMNFKLQETIETMRVRNCCKNNIQETILNLKF